MKRRIPYIGGSGSLYALAGGLAISGMMLMACSDGLRSGPRPTTLVVPSDFSNAYGLSLDEEEQGTNAESNGNARRVIRVTEEDRKNARQIVNGEVPASDFTLPDPETTDTSAFDDAFDGPGDTDEDTSDEQVARTDRRDTSTADTNDKEDQPDVTARTRQAIETAVKTETPLPEPGTAFILDGMVGSVNGRAVYASTIFDPIHEQLQALARRRSPSEFRTEAAQLIGSRLEQFVTDTLIYGQAERDLSQNERMALRGMLAEYREETLRQYGQGSLVRAEHNLMQQRGVTLDQAVEQHRQQLIVRRYLQRTLTPRIVVTFRDIERYYYENINEFQPPAQRMVRLIVVRDDQDARAVQSRLNAGESFVSIAEDEEINFYSPEEGGMWGEVEGEQPFNSADVNEALAKLRVNEYTEAIMVGRQFWFVYIDDVIQKEGIPLRQAQLQIERMLQEQQYRRLSGELRRDLFMTGSYNPLDEMMNSLMQIAMNRYVGGVSAQN